MKVFFAVSPKGKKQFEKYYKTIYEEISKCGYEHVNDDVIEESPTEFYNSLEKGGKEKHKDLYKRKIQAIQIADINIFDCSVPGIGLGFVIQKSIELNKPTIVLYYKDAVPYYLTGLAEDRLITKSYNEKNVKKVIKQALEIARERKDKRFNFFISPQLLDYLEDQSKEEGITKSKFIRNLIVKHMRKQASEIMEA